MRSLTATVGLWAVPAACKVNMAHGDGRFVEVGVKALLSARLRIEGKLSVLHATPVRDRRSHSSWTMLLLSLEVKHSE